MSRPDYALILPISDIDLARDEGRKLRIAGHVTSIDPNMATTVVLSDDGASLLVDLSLCINPEPDKEIYSRAHAGGWKLYRDQQQQQQMGVTTIVPPTLKSVCMIIGHLRKLQHPINTGFIDKSMPASASTEPRVRHATLLRQVAPNRFFVLEAMLIKELDHTFDLALWNKTARLRSQEEWKTVPSRTAQNKRKERPTH